MSERLRGVVVAHGGLAEALVAAVAEISGERERLVPVTNHGCDRASLEERVASAVGDEPAVVFVDMASGSCMLAVLRRLRSRPGVSVVTGVNLAMLLDFVFQDGLTPEAAAARAAETGEAAIKVP